MNHFISCLNFDVLCLITWLKLETTSTTLVMTNVIYLFLKIWSFNVDVMNLWYYSLGSWYLSHPWYWAYGFSHPWYYCTWYWMRIMSIYSLSLILYGSLDLWCTEMLSEWTLKYFSTKTCKLPCLFLNACLSFVMCMFLITE